MYFLKYFQGSKSAITMHSASIELPWTNKDSVFVTRERFQKSFT